MDQLTDQWVSRVHQIFLERKWTLSVAESCTGGFLAAALVLKPGASKFFLGGVVSYAESAKRDLLGVSSAVLQAHGAVSALVAIHMARGVRGALQSTWAIAVSGVAGPDGGCEKTPVGTVFVAVVGPEIECSFDFMVNTDQREQFYHKVTRLALESLLQKVL